MVAALARLTLCPVKTASDAGEQPDARRGQGVPRSLFCNLGVRPSGGRFIPQLSGGKMFRELYLED